ncbi:MAG: glycerol kinase GlpK [Pseudomonadota bacterium]|nr:glycerol kinase GlpK [Pseudomonadota bacterium]
MFLVIDQGTTSTKVILFDIEGKKIDVSQKSFKQIFPKDGWVEHNPKEIIETVINCCNEIIDRNSNLTISSVGITNQRETVVLWDKQTGEPFYNAIVWQDRRTEDKCRQLKENNLEASISKKTGLILDPYFSSTKISWLIENTEGILDKIKNNQVCAGTIDSWIVWNLTNGEIFATDVTNASRTNLYNINSLEWDDELLQIFEIDKKILPEVRDSDSFYGETKALIKKIPIYGVIGDQQSAAIGQFCFDEGDIKSTYGTGCFVLLNTGTKIVKSKNGILSTIGYRINNKISYALEGSIFMAGAIIDWLKNNLQAIDNYNEIDNKLNTTTINPNIVLVPAFTGLGAPHWSPNSRASIFGLTRDSKMDEIIASSIQAVSLQTNDLLNALNDDISKQNIISFKKIKIDGGMAENNWFLQNLSDICNITISQSHEKEATSLGAAIVSGIGSGKIKNLREFETILSESRDFKPKMDNKLRDKIILNWNSAVKQTIGMSFE